jgi:hypothetical protein
MFKIDIKSRYLTIGQILRHPHRLKVYGKLKATYPLNLNSSIYNIIARECAMLKQNRSGQDGQL